MAQDLTGEVFYRVAAAWHRHDPSKGAISTWIFTIAKNLLRDHCRRKKFTPVELPEIPDSGDLSELAEKAESIRNLRQALATLSGRERKIIYLKYAFAVGVAYVL